VQTVSQAADPRFHALLSAFEAETGCPVLVNTSFNVRGEPIVCTPADAIRCFLDTHMDILVLENILVDKRLIPGAASDIKTAEEIAAAHGLD
jgi:carbamoyltransferase